jgi:hypothetical protein
MVTHTPDRIATGVAAAKAIAATLTAEIPTATPVTPSTSTPFQSPTSTPTIKTTNYPTPSITSTQKPEPTETRMGSIHGDVYGIEIISVKLTDSYQEMGIFRKYIYPESNHVFLEVKVLLYKLNEPIWDDDEISKLAVVDTLNTRYPPKYAMVQGTIDPEDKFTALNYTIYFSVPDNLTGFRLSFRDLSLFEIWE